MEKEERGKGVYSALKKGIIVGGLSLATMLGPSSKAVAQMDNQQVSEKYGKIMSYHGAGIKDSEYPKITGDEVYFVTEGVSKSEVMANQEAYHNASLAALKMSGKNRARIEGLINTGVDTYKVKKDDQEIYVVKSLFSVPLSNFSKEAQNQLIEKYGKKQEKEEPRRVFVYNESSTIERDGRTEQVEESIHQDVTNYKNLRSIVEKQGKFVPGSKETKYIAGKDFSIVIQSGNNYLGAKVSVDGKPYDLLDSNEDGVADEIKINGKYQRIQIADKTQRQALKKYLEIVDSIVNKKAEKKGLETLIKGLMLLSGTGVLYSMYTGTQTIEGAQSTEFLAPPMASYWPYAFAAILVIGTTYFVAKAIKRKHMEEIPLSF